MEKKERLINLFCKIGIRLLDGEVTDLVESMALDFRQDFIDIYSASWWVTFIFLLYSKLHLKEI